MNRLKEQAKGNVRLKLLVVELTNDKAILKEAAWGNS